MNQGIKKQKQTIQCQISELWGIISQWGISQNTALFHIFMMLILKDFCWGLGVVEQLVDFLHLLPLHRLLPLNTTQHTGWCQQLYGVPARKHWQELSQYKESTITNSDYLGRARCVFHMFLFILNHNFTSWYKYCDILFPKMSLFYFLAALPKILCYT